MLAEKEGGSHTCRGVFIRAPAILEVGQDVEVLADCPVPAGRPSITITSGEGVEVCSFFFCSLEFDHNIYLLLPVIIFCSYVKSLEL